MICFTCFSDFALLNVSEKIGQIWEVRLSSYVLSVKHKSSSRHHSNHPSGKEIFENGIES